MVFILLFTLFSFRQIFSSYCINWIKVVQFPNRTSASNRSKLIRNYKIGFWAINGRANPRFYHSRVFAARPTANFADTRASVFRRGKKKGLIFRRGEIERSVLRIEFSPWIGAKYREFLPESLAIDPSRWSAHLSISAERLFPQRMYWEIIVIDKLNFHILHQLKKMSYIFRLTSPNSVLPPRYWHNNWHMSSSKDCLTSDRKNSYKLSPRFEHFLRTHFDGDTNRCQTFLLLFQESPHLETSFKDMKKTRNLESYVQWFNRLSYFVATEVCKVRALASIYPLNLHRRCEFKLQLFDEKDFTIEIKIVPIYAICLISINKFLFIWNLIKV